MRKLKFLMLLLFLAMSPVLFAQKVKVTGVVLDAATGSPLSNVTVKAKSGVSVVSGTDGTFSIEVSPSELLLFSYVGYENAQATAKAGTPLSIKMLQTSGNLSDIVLVGTRSGGRIKTETTVPVDVVSVAKTTMPTGRMDITSVLNYAAPSFNFNKQSGSDGADHIDLATLRGLGPDQTLVLINGKRRHQTAFVAVFGTRGRGNSGTDLNAIPLAAIDRVEILRDGASAQYGSDAIAGVINIILKKDVSHFSGNLGWSGYYDKKFNTYYQRSSHDYPYVGAIDGNAAAFNGNYGLPLGKNGGFLNIGGTFNASQKTVRQDKDVLGVNYVRRANGDGSLVDGGAMFNMEIPVAHTKTTFYSFGGMNYNASDAFAFSRSWAGKPQRFPTGEYNPATMAVPLIYVPSIMYLSSDGDTVFNPHIQTHVQDYSLAAGLRGTTATGWNWDLSNTTGTNDFHFYGDKTFNASLNDPAKNHFDDGGFSFLQNTANLNFSKKIKAVGAGMNLAFGAEYRYEQYKIKAGEEASYKSYGPHIASVSPIYDDNGVLTGYDTVYKAGGSQGFPGYQPSDVVNAHRSNIAAYVDAEVDITNAFLIDAAIRAENYSDFGFTSNYKLAARYKASRFFNLRGSVSTGFRAPSLQQINFSSTFTTVQGGHISEVKIAPNYSPITKAAGIPDLKQEKSLTASLGFAWTPMRELSITVDGYYVKIKDRVVLSGQFDASDPTLDADLTSTLQNLNVGLAQFFANAVNTTNTGIDIVADYNHQWGKQHFRALLTGNIQHMTLDKINVPAKLNDSKDHQKTFLSDREQAFILASAPKAKGALTLDYGYGNFGLGTRLTYFGKVKLLGYGEDGLGIDPQVPSDADPNTYIPDVYNYSGKMVTDLYFSWKFSKSSTLYWGADNLFNIHPDLGYVKAAPSWAWNNENGGPFDAVQMGQNGTRLFIRIGFNF